MNAKQVFEKLVSIAQNYSWRLSSSLGYRREHPGKPGELLDRLTPEEREELKNLSSKDMAGVRGDDVIYWTDAYPENTTTVHTHSVKKEDEHG